MDASNKLALFHFKNESNTSRQTIILAHGNSTDIGHFQLLVAQLCDFLKVDIVSQDYSGYGMSDGVPSDQMMCVEVEAVQRQLRSKVAFSKIFVQGWSIGSVAAIHLASCSQCPVNGLITHCALASGQRAVSREFILEQTKTSGNRSKWFDVFLNAEKIKKVRCPILMIHGTEDEIVHISNSQLLWDNSGSKEEYKRFWWVPGGKHDNVES